MALERHRPPLPEDFSEQPRPLPLVGSSVALQLPRHQPSADLARHQRPQPVDCLARLPLLQVVSLAPLPPQHLVLEGLGRRLHLFPPQEVCLDRLPHLHQQQAVSSALLPPRPHLVGSVLPLLLQLAAYSVWRHPPQQEVSLAVPLLRPRPHLAGLVQLLPLLPLFLQLVAYSAQLLPHPPQQAASLVVPQHHFHLEG